MARKSTTLSTLTDRLQATGAGRYKSLIFSEARNIWFELRYFLSGGWVGRVNNASLRNCYVLFQKTLEKTQKKYI